MGAALRAWRRFYGENPLHLLTVIGCFALAGYVVVLLIPDPSAIWILIWFAGAIIAHDLILYPLYALADQPLTLSRSARRKALPHRPPLIPAINHTRAPVLGALVLGLIYFPTLTQRGQDGFLFASGHPMIGQYENWLLITGLLFLGSAAIYALRWGAAARRRVAGRAITREPQATVSDDEFQNEDHAPGSSPEPTIQPSSQPGTRP
jgi:hypothetical protein